MHSTRNTLGVLLCLTLFGCISRPKHLRLETFGFAPPSRTAAPAGDSAPILVLRSVRVVPAYQSQDFLYRAADYRFERDFYAHFLAPPDQLIRSASLDLFQASGLFRAVVSGVNAIPSRGHLDLSVRELYGDFRPGWAPAAVISLRFLLIESPDGMPLWNRTLLRRIPLRERSPSALMRGWDTGLRQIIAEASPSLAKQLQAAEEKAQKAAEKAAIPPARKTAPAPLPPPTLPSETR